MRRLSALVALLGFALGCSAPSPPAETSQRLPSNRGGISSKRVLEAARLDDKKAAEKEDATFWPGMLLVNDRREPEIHIPPKRCGRDAVPALVGSLERGNDAGIRSSAASWLGAVGPDAREAIPPLKRALRDPSPTVREEAARALKCIEGASGSGDH